MTRTSQVGSLAGDKAGVLVEALPYIRRFRDKVVVVKQGGAALAAGGEGTPSIDSALASFARDIVLMHAVGMKPVVVHGGGPQIGQLMAKLGKQSEFRDGLRVTDAETLDIARMVLVGKVNIDIVSAINVHGPLAVGLSGEDAGLIKAGPHPAELGYVGQVEDVDPGIVQRLLAQGLIPVIATIGSDHEGQSYNINADTVAGAIAEAVSASKLVFLTDVDGLRGQEESPESLIRTIGVDQLDEMIASGALAGGMLPKAQACARAVRQGVGQAHILDGRLDHALLLEIFTAEGVGTMVSP